MLHNLPNGLEIELDDETGQLLRLRDPKLEMDVLSYRPGTEFALNGCPVSGKSTTNVEHDGEMVTISDCDADQPTYKAGRRYRLCRRIVPGAFHNHTGRSNSVHLRFQLKRKPWGEWDGGLDQIWGAPLEAPLFVETLTALCGETDWFGPETRMRQLALGGSGPREHVSLEDGKVGDVVPYLQGGFRNTFPGQSSIPGALYYHPDDERWVWVFVHRPQVGGQVEYRDDGQAFRFAYFKQMKLHDELVCPDIAIYWGRGLKEADRVLAEQFDLYQEPPAWWFNTTWFWLHPMWQPDATFPKMEKAIEILMDECGVNGFGMGIHDIPLAGRDIEDRSYFAHPVMGGDDGLKRCCDLINRKGGHSYVWYTRTAMHPSGDCRGEWAVRGEDGRKISLDSIRLDILDCMHPGYEQYILNGIEYYVKDIGVTGIFWDSAYQPMPPDFGERSFLESPGEAMICAPRLYDKALRFGKRLSSDFFMWAEGLTTECASNGFAVDNRTHGENSGHLLMHRIAHAGPRRLVWRSAWPHDVSGAFPFIKPVSDIHRNPGPDFYKKISADPMNQWVCRTVKDRGCRQARGVADGVAVLDEFLVVSPGQAASVEVPEEICPSTSLVHEIDRTKVSGESADGKIRFDLPKDGAWKMG